jgi:hypothetical protein
MVFNFGLYVHAAAFIFNYVLQADILNARNQEIPSDDSFGDGMRKVLRFAR